MLPEPIMVVPSKLLRMPTVETSPTLNLPDIWQLLKKLAVPSMNKRPLILLDPLDVVYAMPRITPLTSRNVVVGGTRGILSIEFLNKLKYELMSVLKL